MLEKEVVIFSGIGQVTVASACRNGVLFILLLDEGKSSVKIALNLYIRKVTVNKWRIRFPAQKFEGLRDKLLLIIVLSVSLMFVAAGECLAASNAPASAMMTAGGELFAKNCAACHQVSGKGIPGAFPPLAGNSNLKDTKLVVRTIHDGKSGPITVKGAKFESTMPPIGAGFSPGQIAAVATYVRNSWGNSFGAVTKSEVLALLQAKRQAAKQIAPRAETAPAEAPAAVPMEYAPPDSRMLPASLKGVPRGGRLFRLYCAGCHGATARGGAVAFAGMNAPSLMHVPAAAIPVFMREGPGPMPAFQKEVLSHQDVEAVAEYVGFLQRKPHPGGFALGFLGPVAEGFVAMIGLLAIVLCAIWIEKGEKG